MDKWSAPKKAPKKTDAITSSRNKVLARYHELFMIKVPTEEQVQEMEALWKRLQR